MVAHTTLLEISCRSSNILYVCLHALVLCEYLVLAERRLVLLATNQRVVAASRQQRGLVALTIRGSVLFYSSAI